MRKAGRYLDNAKSSFRRRMLRCATVLTIIGWIIMTMFLMKTLVNGSVDRTNISLNGNITGKFETNVLNHASGILENIIPQKQRYILNDSDIIAPQPYAECYGATEDPQKINELLSKASALLGSQETLFTSEIKIKKGSRVSYYLDETILALTWKQAIDDSVYTFAEVIIAHPSQFRRFLSDGQYGASTLYTTTEMAKSVNAVIASSGDYYGYRSIGVVVNEGKVCRDRGHYLDTCYIDDRGDLIFTYAGDITDAREVQKFVKENKIRFSLSFGPVMILDGKLCVPDKYNSGEISKHYARAALCQLGPLHYVIVTANTEDPYYSVPTMKQFAQHLQECGIPKAYALDGGQTATIVMDNQLINTVSYGSQRKISDIIYFATAIPEMER